MSKIDKVRVDNVDYDIVSGDNLPVGTEVDFDGTAQDIPTGWEQTSDEIDNTLQIFENANLTIESQYCIRIKNFIFFIVECAKPSSQVNSWTNLIKTKSNYTGLIPTSFSSNVFVNTNNGSVMAQCNYYPDLGGYVQSSVAIPTTMKVRFQGMINIQGGNS